MTFRKCLCVHHTYSDRAKKYVRMHGKPNFGAGAEVTDVFRVIDEYGMVPEDIYYRA